MPRVAGAVNNEFLPTESIARSPVVLCRHCRAAKITKSSSKRKVAHLRKCPGYRIFLGDSPMPTFDSDMVGDDGDEAGDGDFNAMGQMKDRRISKATDPERGRVNSSLPYRWPLASPIRPDTTALVILDMQRDFCEPDGLLAQMGHPIAAARSVVPPILSILDLCRQASLPVYHCRHSHRHDLSTLSALDRVKFASPSASPAPHPTNGYPIMQPVVSSPPTRLSLPLPGTQGLLGHFLLRQSAGTDPVVELRPLYQEVLVDHPRPSAFSFTDLDLLLRNRNIQNLILVGLDVNSSLVSTARDAADRRYDILLVEGCIAPASSRYPHMDPPPSQEQTSDLGLCAAAAREALDAVLPRDWRLTSGSSGPGAVATHASVLSTLVSLVPPPPTTAQNKPQQQHIPSPGSLRPDPNHSPVYNGDGSGKPTPPQHQPLPPHPTSNTSSFRPPSLAPRPPFQPPTTAPQPQTDSKADYPYTLPPGGRAGAGGRRGRGINDPIFYSPPKAGVPHPQRRSVTGKTKTGAAGGGADAVPPATTTTANIGNSVLENPVAAPTAANGAAATSDNTIVDALERIGPVEEGTNTIDAVATEETPQAKGGGKLPPAIEEVVMTDDP